MSNPLQSPGTWAPGSPADPSELLRRIEANTRELATWMKYLLGAVIVLVIIDALFII